MKRKIFAVATAVLLSSSIASAFCLKYHNADSKNYEFKVKTCGTTETVDFQSSTTSTSCFTGCKDAVIITPCGEFTVHPGDKIEIKNGCITIK